MIDQASHDHEDDGVDGYWYESGNLHFFAERLVLLRLTGGEASTVG